MDPTNPKPSPSEPTTTPPTSGEAPKPAAPAPASTPAVSPASAEPTVDFSDILDLSGEGETSDAEPPAPAPAVQPAPATPAPAPAVTTTTAPAPAPTEPKPAPTPAEEPKPTPAPAVEPTPAAPAAAAEPPKPATPVPSADWQKVRNEARTKLKETYSLGEEGENIFGKQAAARLTEMAADLHMNTYESLFNAFQAAMPQMIEDFMALRDAKGKFEDAFFKEYPALKPFAGEVHQRLQLTAAMYPTLSAEELRSQVGLALSIAKKLPLPGMQPVSAGPAAPVEPIPATTVFAPAAPGGGGATALPPRSPGAGNVFAEMSVEDEQDGH